MYAVDKRGKIEYMDYDLEQMPNGEFVGEVYNLTHDVIKALKSRNDSNQCFMEAEKTIRDYVWKSCQRAVDSQKENEDE